MMANHPDRVRQNYCNHQFVKERNQDKRLSIGIEMKCTKCGKRILAPGETSCQKA